MRSCSDASSSSAAHRDDLLGQDRSVVELGGRDVHRAARDSPRPRPARRAPRATPGTSGSSEGCVLSTRPSKASWNGAGQHGAEAGHGHQVDVALDQRVDERAGVGLAVEVARRSRRSRARSTSRASMPARVGDLEAAARPVRRDDGRRRSRRSSESPRGSCPASPSTSDGGAGTRLKALERPGRCRPSARRPRWGCAPPCTPAALSASILACAVPLEPEMIAPAWPILRPGGAVTPAT